MAEPWIKLIIHPEHPKVLRLAELLRLQPDEVFAKMVRWFRYVDANLASAACAIGSASLCAICRFHPDRNKSQTEDTLVEAMVAVGWLGRGEAGGPLQVLEFDKHFGKNAKIRAQAADRQKALREKRYDSNANSNASSVTRNAVSATPFLSSSHSFSVPLKKQEDATRDSAPTPRPDCAPTETASQEAARLAAEADAVFGGDGDIPPPPTPLLLAVRRYCDSVGIGNESTRYRIYQDCESWARPEAFGPQTVAEGLRWGIEESKPWKVVASRIRNAAEKAGWIDGKSKKASKEIPQWRKDFLEGKGDYAPK